MLNDPGGVASDSAPYAQKQSASTPAVPSRLGSQILSSYLAGIARAVDVSSLWLQDYVNKKYDAVSMSIDVTPKKKGKITIQCDFIKSFVMNKDNKQWIWLGSRHRNRGNCRSLHW
jgi:hypothetical protein